MDGRQLLAEVTRIAAELQKGHDTYTGGPKHFHHMGHLREAAYPWISDIEIAGRVRMLGRHDLNHEGIVCAARDRILHLSEENERLRKELYMRTRSLEETLKQTSAAPPTTHHE